MVSGAVGAVTGDILALFQGWSSGALFSVKEASSLCGGWFPGSLLPVGQPDPGTRVTLLWLKKDRYWSH